MAQGVSTFYPPRARWYSPLTYLGMRLVRRLSLSHIHLPRGVSPGGVLAAILFPGVAFYVCAPRFWSKLAMGLSAVLVLMNIVLFGSRPANLAFGLLLSIHASGLAFMFDRMLPAPGFRARLLMTAALLASLVFGLYLPVRSLVQDRWFFPLRQNGRVIVIRRERPTAHLNRGDRIGYSFDGFQVHELVVHSGFGLGPVLALPGDRILFTKSTFEVNGNAQPRFALMPESGEIILDERHWFVWPEFDIRGHGNVMGQVPQTLTSLGIISERQFLGRPCRRWFWHKQLE